MEASTMIRFGAALVTLLIVSTAFAGPAFFTSWQTASYGPDSVDWGTPTPQALAPVFSQFDTMGGSRILAEVDWTFDGDIYGTSKGENTDPDKDHTLTLTLGVAEQLYDLGGNPLGSSINPTNTQTFNATKYDGTLDFGGTSGVTFSGLTGSASNSGTITSGLAAYIGGGTFSYSADAKGSSKASGSGNMVSQFISTADATAQIRYGYDLVPEPTTGALMLTGLVGALLLRRRRK
jgi:hypothetical protein